MQNVIGRPVTGEDFFERPALTKEILNALDSNNPILLSSPRRSGKTSLLRHFQKKYNDRYNFIYVDSEAIFKRQKYYERIYETILASSWFPLEKPLMKWDNFTDWNGEENYLKKYQNALLDLLKLYSENKPLIIMIDDYHNVVDKFLKEKKIKSFLVMEREFRVRLNALGRNITIIYTSSLDLFSYSKDKESVSALNDLYPLRLRPFSPEEAETFILQAKRQYNFTISPAQIALICREIQWLSPFYIQFFLSELGEIVSERNLRKISENDIYDAIHRMLGKWNYFNDWKDRLEIIFENNELTFAIEMLTDLSHQGEITTKKVNKIAEMHNVGENRGWIIQTLIHEDYINDSKDNGIYRFNSPLLKTWWQIQHPKPTGVSYVGETPTLKADFPPIKLQRIIIQDIKCFENLEIDFTSSGNLTVFIGNNGKGKSTILQLIALGLRGLIHVPRPNNWRDVVKKGKDTGFFTIDILFNEEPFRFKFEINEEDFVTCVENREKLFAIRDRFLFAAYGVSRQVKLEDSTPHEVFDPIGTLFSDNGYLKNLKVSMNYEHVRNNFKYIRPMINHILDKADGGDNVQLVDFDPGSFYFLTPSSREIRVPIEALSEGYKSTFIWLFDIMIRIIEQGGSLENAKDISGIILLDEIDLHLHPTWQRTILHSIESLFPNIQFIVTTHSPFIVQSARKESLIALEMEKDTDNVVMVDKEYTSELSYASIVDEIFGIDFPFSHHVEQKVKQFREFQRTIRQNKPYDEKEFKKLVLDIAGKGDELHDIMYIEIKNLEKRTGKEFNIWNE